jgi:hypothetical protein
MRTIRLPSLIISAIVGATTLLSAHRAAAEPPTNVARGRPYTLTPSPNYGLTTDADDVR